MALRPHGAGGGPQRPPLGPERGDLADSFLLGLMRHELAGAAEPYPA
jgi:hypothetical protein